MKRHVLILLLLLTFTAQPAQAETRDSDLRELIVRASEALANPGSAADRDAAAKALLAAISELEREAPAPVRRPHGERRAARERDACVELGVRAYSQTQFASVALDNAMAQCSEPVDAAIVAIAFEVFRQTQYDAVAFEMALPYGRNRALSGKASLVQFAATQYAQTQYARTAFELATRLVTPLSVDQEPCVRMAFGAYSETQYPQTAIEQAVRKCQASP